MASRSPLFSEQFIDCDESSIDVESDLGDLDGHHCPVCMWSFRGRRPRMLRCGHAFYFCERCLKFKKSIRCASCAAITELTSKSESSQETSPKANVADLEKHVVTLRAELNEKTKENMGRSVQNMDYIQKNRELAQRLEDLSQQQKDWRQKSEDYLTSKSEVNELRSKNAELEKQLHLFRNENERLILEAETTAERVHKMETEFRVANTPNRSLEAEVQELRKRLQEMEKNERGMMSELTETRQQYAESQSHRQHLERERSVHCTQLQDIQTTNSDRNSLLRRRCVHMSESIRELRNEIAFARKELPQNVGRYGQWFAVQMSNMVHQYGNREKRVEQLITAYDRESKLRRKYFNVIQELKGNIRVYCRIRPMLDNETLSYGEGCDPVAVTNTNDFCVRVNMPNDPKRNKQFEYDKVFGPTSTQETVFEDTKQLVTSVLDGYDVCIFAYGQTGSGKTFTMQGPPGNRGIYFRAIDELFGVIESRKNDCTYQLKMSMMEIYNERIRDLLNETPVDSVDVALQNKPVYLNLHERRDGTVFADGVTEWEASSVADIHRALRNGANNRSVGITNLNEHSSRSHSILTIEAVGRNNKSGEEYLGKLNLIDLAGSERINRSGVRDQQLKEAQCINKSLSALGNVIEALKRKAIHVPFRDSKLTFLLQNSLAGQSKTLMFVNVSPAMSDVDETACSLNFANRVRNTSLGQASRHVRHRSSSPFASPSPATPHTSRSSRQSLGRSNPRLKSAPAQSKSVSFVQHR